MIEVATLNLSTSNGVGSIPAGHYLCSLKNSEWLQPAIMYSKGMASVIETHSCHAR
jgi:hypothetical protein